MRSVIIIPARYKSSRFPGKPLVNLCGKPMVIWVAELCARALSREDVYVATEDRRIVDVVEAHGFQAILTGDSALTGTDRIAEAVQQIEADIILNVQGDEPILDPADILRIRDAKLANLDEVINGYAPLDPSEDPANINIPKVIFTEDRRLVYMSRRALPGFKVPEQAPKVHYKQVCIYAFTREELQRYGRHGRKSVLEACEDIEILRFLEWGKSIRMVETTAGSAAVDVPGDVEILEAKLRAVHA